MKTKKTKSLNALLNANEKYLPSGLNHFKGGTDPAPTPIVNVGNSIVDDLNGLIR